MARAVCGAWRADIEGIRGPGGHDAREAAVRVSLGGRVLEKMGVDRGAHVFRIERAVVRLYMRK